MLVAVFLIVPAIGYAVVQLSCPAELNWREYSNSRLQRCINDNRFVLICLTADWDVSTYEHKWLLMNSEPVQSLLRQHAFVTFEVSPSNSPRAFEEYSERWPGHCMLPATILLSLSQSEHPVHLEGRMDEEGFLQAIQDLVEK